MRFLCPPKPCLDLYLTLPHITQPVSTSKMFQRNRKCHFYCHSNFNEKLDIFLGGKLAFYITKSLRMSLRMFDILTTVGIGTKVLVLVAKALIKIAKC